MKKYAFGLIAIVFAVAGSAYTTISKVKANKNATAIEWFLFNGNVNSPTDLVNESLYDKIAPEDVDALCSSNNKVCAVQTLEAGTSGHPQTFSPTMESEILNANSSSTTYPYIKERP